MEHLPSERSRLLIGKPQSPSKESSVKFTSMVKKVSYGGLVTFGILGTVAILNKTGITKGKGALKKFFLPSDFLPEAVQGFLRSERDPIYESTASASLGSDYDLNNNVFPGQKVDIPWAFFENTKWHDAPFFRYDGESVEKGHITQEELTEEKQRQGDPKKTMPVLKTAGVDLAQVVVTAHATSMKEIGWVLYDSAKNQGLEMVISGVDTPFHGFADKVIGLKAALHAINGNPIVVVADASDVFLQCSAAEFQERFTQADADLVFGGETQLWPEISDYFSREAEKAVKNKGSQTLLKVGQSTPYNPINPGDIPNGWPNAGGWMARKEALLEYISSTENRMAKFATEEWPGEWGYQCKPDGATDADWNGKYAGLRGFDDQLCLNAYAMGKWRTGDTRHKLDADGSILFSTNGCPLSDTAMDKKNKVYYKYTGKAPCLWHMNNPIAKIRLKEFASAYPNHFLTPEGNAAMAATPDEHPGHRPASSLGKKEKEFNLHHAASHAQ